MVHTGDVMGPDNGAGLSNEIKIKDLVADVSKDPIVFVFSV
jgi:hypothetical protein